MTDGATGESLPAEEAVPPTAEAVPPPRRTPRLFVAVALPKPAADTVRELVGRVRATVDEQAPTPRSEVRWVRLDGLHVTLRFLGPTPDERVRDVGAAVERVAARARPFDVRLRGAGGFPSPRRPRVLWLGLVDGEEAMAALAHDIDEAMAPLGWEGEIRPFRGHLTVARADGRREGPLAAQTLSAAAAGWEVGFRAERLTLFESLTGGGPARYVPRLEVPLGG